LRDDADLKYLAPPVKTKTRGRPRKCAGKIDVKNIDRSKFIEVHIDETKRISEIIAYSVGMKRKLIISYVEFLGLNGQVKTSKIFFSTNLERSAKEIYSYYKARFQTEFIFRDASNTLA